jgi:xylulose-5-phosphate/fructose-6-phosphate phosphoketolase
MAGKIEKEISWRALVPSINILITSLVWRQDHNGFTHQDPGFLNVVTNKSRDIARIYLPPDANCLLRVIDHCLRSHDYVNVIVADKQEHLQYLSMEEAVTHCTKGIGIWEWASNEGAAEPDVVLGCAGDVPTLEVLAATDILRRELPDLRVRVVNVVDLMRLEPDSEHPHGMSDAEFNALFPPGRPIIFAYHGYPWLIHRLTYRRDAHHDIHVRGYKEEGATTTPFDMVVMNDMDRFHLVMDVIDRVPGLISRAGELRQKMVDTRARHRAWTRERGEDLPEVSGWTWPQPKATQQHPAG